MNQDIFQGKWDQIKGQVRQKWGKLTNDDLEKIHGRTEELKGRLQERYGLSKDEAEKQINQFSRSLK